MIYGKLLVKEGFDASKSNNINVIVFVIIVKTTLMLYKLACSQYTRDVSRNKINNVTS